MYSSSNQNNRLCYSCGQHGHLVRDCPKAHSFNQGRMPDNRLCYSCGQYGHLVRDYDVEEDEYNA
uniref:CCHC-type domain-containing protein n=1 Tax=Oryzias melastigma TaxID=30732 RepID=A0A3B3DK81_ORYME